MRPVHLLRASGILVSALLLAFTGAARADLFTYDLVGTGGSDPLSGFITISGTAGNSFSLDTSLDGVTNYNFDWNSGAVDFNSSDAFQIGNTVDFTGNLGDPVLTPISGNLDSLIITGFIGPFPFFGLLPTGFELDLNAGPTSWNVNNFPFSQLDAGTSWDLELASVSTSGVPLPSGLQMSLAGMLLLASAAGYSSLRRRAPL